jgi:hypothetical protein
VESNWVHSARRPQIGLLYMPRVIMTMENLVEEWLSGETEKQGEKKNAPAPLYPPQIPRDLTGREPGPRGGKQRQTAWAMARSWFALCIIFQSYDAGIAWCYWGKPQDLRHNCPINTTILKTSDTSQAIRDCRTPFFMFLILYLHLTFKNMTRLSAVWIPRLVIFLIAILKHVKDEEIMS